MTTPAAPDVFNSNVGAVGDWEQFRNWYGAYASWRVQYTVGPTCKFAYIHANGVEVAAHPQINHRFS